MLLVCQAEYFMSIKTNGKSVQLFLCKNIHYAWTLEDVHSEGSLLEYVYTTAVNVFSSTIVLLGEFCAKKVLKILQ